MSCLLNPQIQDALRKKIANNIVAKANNNEVVNLTDYVKEIYNFFKDKGQAEDFSVDAARLVPLFLDQIISLKPEVNSLLRKNNPSIRHEIIDLSDKFEDSIDNVRSVLGLTETAEELFGLAQEEVIAKENETPVKLEEESIEYNSFPDGAFRTFGPEFIEWKDKDKPGYLEPRPEEVHNFNVQRSITKALAEQVESRGISNSSQLEYPGMYGGIYLKMTPDNKGYKDLIMTVVDQYGSPIKFDVKGDITFQENGKEATYKVASDPLTNAEGELILSETDLSKRLAEKHVGERGASIYKNILSNINKQIEDQVRSRTEGRGLTSEEKEQVRKDIIKKVKANYESLNKMRSYLHAEPNRFITNVINGNYKGFIAYHVWSKTDLSAIRFDKPFSPIVETKEQVAESSLKPGIVYFSYPDVDKPITAVAKNINESPEILDKITNLFTKDLYIDENTPVSINERNNLIEQYLYSSDIKFLSNEVGGGGKNWLNSDGSYSIKIGDVKHKIKFGNSPEALDMQKKVSDAIKLKLTTPYLATNEKGYPQDNDLNSITKVNTAIKQGAIVLQGLPGQSFSEALNTDPRQYNIFGYAKTTGDKPVLDKHGKQVYVYYKVYYPTLHAKNNLINKDYNDVNFNEKDGKTLLVRNTKKYNDFIINNFKTAAFVKDGVIKAINPYLAFQPTLSEKAKVETIGTKSESQEVKEITETKVEPTITGPSIADMSVDDIRVALRARNKRLEKNANQKSANADVTDEQIKAAEDWYKSSPLSKHFPFQNVFAAVNVNKPGPIAQWTIDGISLFQYFKEDGRVNPEVSSDTTDLYHEAWHGFTQTFLTKDQRTKLYNEAASKPGSFVDYKGKRVAFKNAKPWQLEEYLAEDFRGYMLSGGKTKDSHSKERNSLFRKILDFFKNLFGKSTLQDIIDNPLGQDNIQALYEKLKVGDLSAYTFDIKNRDEGIGYINKSLIAIDGKTELSLDDANLLVTTLDSMISDEVNTMVDDGYTANVIKDADSLLMMYKLMKHEFENTLLKKLQRERADAQSAFEEDQIDENIKLVRYAIDNFGDVNKLTNNKGDKGLIAYHRLKSQYLTKEDTETFFDDVDEVTQLLNSKDNAFDRSGNEVSLLERANPEIINMLRSIHKYDETGKPVLNRLGIHTLADYHDVANKIARTVKGSTDRISMFNKLKQGAYKKGVEGLVKDPLLAEVIKKLGDPTKATDTTSMRLSIGFWSAFNLAEIKLVQMNIEEEAGKYDVTVGTNHKQSKKASAKWENEFRTSTTEYIKRDLDPLNPSFSNRSYLDVPHILKSFGENGKLKPGSAFEFFRAIGVTLSNKDEIKDAVNKGVGSAGIIFNRLKLLANRLPVSTMEGPISKIYNLTDVFKEYPAGDKNTSLPSENVNYDDLRELENTYADYASGNMVANAEGNTQSELSLNNSLSVMMGALNDVKSYTELLSLPYMQHLDINKNPFANASIWLNSLFDIDDYRQGGLGTKRKKSASQNAPDVKITMSNLSGAQLISAEGDEGIASAKADEFTKLILDFHLAMSGKPELMRHADKGTSFSVWLSDIISPVGNGKNYVDTTHFVKNDTGVVRGYGLTADLLSGHINAEFLRIKTLNDLAKQKDLDYDLNYLKAGQKFIIFEEILSPGIQEEILKYDTFIEIEGLNPELIAKVNVEISNYFDKQFEDVKTLMSRADFVSPSLITETFRAINSAGVSDKAVTKVETKDALIRSFVVNSWIHNLESMSVIYGDLAQYNLAKEEFHKRNAGAGSTGLLFTADPNALNYVNKKGRLYARSQGLFEKEMALDGTYDAAILEDNIIPSSTYDDLLKSVTKNMSSKIDAILDPKQKAIAKQELTAKAAIAVDAYLKNNEGDAQGWITFDFYRNLSMLKNQWSDQQERLYNEVLNGREVDFMSQEFFPTCKFQYWGPVQTKEGQPPLMGFHKFSLLPLIPSMIRGTNLEKLHHKMITQGVDYAMFKSGSKISTITEIKDDKTIEDKFYTNGVKHSFNSEDDHKTVKNFTKNTVFLQFLKDQLTIAPYYKEEVTFPTQMRKLIENGLMEGGVPTDFMMNKSLSQRETAWSALSEKEKVDVSKRYKKVKEYEADIDALTKIRKDELVKEANITYKNGEIVLTEKLRNFLLNELKRQDFGEHEMAFIKSGPDGTIAHDFSLSFSSEKLEKMLNSIVVKRLIKQKFKGEGLIQISGAGFESSELRGDLSPEEQAKYGSNGLPFYRYGKGKDGVTGAMKVKISLQGDFVNLLYLQHSDGEPIRTRERLNQMLKNVEWLNKDNHRKMVSIIGPRIPVQGLNSMEFAEVYEFLPIEAGNIVVLPTEIVAKAGSDFDIDKLTFMMPNISSGINYDYWTTPESKNDKEYLQYRYSELDFTQENIDRVIAGRKNKERSLEDRAILTAIKEITAKNVTYITDKSTAEGLENSILERMRDILEMPENFVDLVRANGTEIVKEGLADELASDVMDFNPRTITDKGKKRISGTRVFEIRYNLYKHASNNIGKQTLGLGAVDNTYNALFNRIGARMNYDYKLNKLTKRIDILLPHNKLKDEKGRDVISLSHINDAEGLTSIADVISQLMNGWVDIAKDAWIFNLQGNKEVTPTLMFMVQAGVPIKQAVYLVSNPMVRAYVKEQQLANSTFAKPLEKAVDFRTDIIKTILTNPKYGINIDTLTLNDNNKYLNALNEKTLELTSRNDSKRPDGKVLDFFNPDKVQANLRERISKFAQDQRSGKEFEYTDADRAVFLHYLELEEMAKSMTAIKTKTNVDTTRAITLFDAQNKLETIEDLKSDGKFPAWMIDKLIGDPEKNIKGESPITSFNIFDFQNKLWKDLFKLRNNQIFNDFILGKIRSKQSGFLGDVENTFGDSERFISNLRNDIVPFIFQNYIRDIDINTIKEYKGITLNNKATLKDVTNLDLGAYVKKDPNGNRVMFIDRAKLKSDYNTLDSERSTALNLAPLKSEMFQNSNSYYNFVLEREILRSMYPGETGWAILQERSDVANKLKSYLQSQPRKSGESDETFNARINTLVYEETLRDMALDNTLNTWKLFRGPASKANQLTQIQKQYPELALKYPIVNNIAASVLEGTDKSNIMLLDMMLDADRINIFNQNLLELADPSKIQLNTTSNEERLRVTKFFDSLSTYAFLQSGMNTRGIFSLIRLVPQEKFTSLITQFSNDFEKNINPLTLQKYYNKFVNVNGVENKRTRSRFRDYTIPSFNPSQDLSSSKGKTEGEIITMANGPFIKVNSPEISVESRVEDEPEFVSSSPTPISDDITVTDEEVREALNFCFK